LVRRQIFEPYAHRVPSFHINKIASRVGQRTEKSSKFTYILAMRDHLIDSPFLPPIIITAMLVIAATPFFVAL
jgi:hypothetical protein